MISVSTRLLCIGVTWSPPPDSAFEAVQVDGIASAIAPEPDSAPFDAILLDGDAVRPDEDDLAALLGAAALLVVIADADAADQASVWLQRGADDVLGRDELSAPATARRIRFAVERRRRDGSRLPAYATDPGTGLPHRQQLVEHLSQMLALREREPSPMAVLVLRIEGLAGGDADAHATGAELLRRKIAVRLRAGVRASDVVAALDDDSFAVLLGAILAPGDAERVADKLAGSLMAPFTVGGGERSIAVAAGIGRYPQDGKDAERLLRRATALAAVAPAAGLAGPAAERDAGGSARVAANDDGA